MYCPKCSLKLRYLDAPTVTHCTLCDSELKYSMSEIFTVNGKFNLVRETRVHQQIMATQINKVLHAKKSILLVEGGTGLGKSFAYLVPTILAGKRMVITTAKKALQDQLYNKDIPYVLNKLGLHKKLNVILYKGASNYACPKLSRLVPATQREKYKQFINTAFKNGHPADLVNWKGKDPFWLSKIHTGNCIYKNNPHEKKDNCPHHKLCNYSGANANNADIIVTNHAILCLDAKLGISTNPLLGEYDTLVVDEAHQLPEIIAETWKAPITGTALHSMLTHIVDPITCVDCNLVDTPTWQAITQKTEATMQAYNSYTNNMLQQTGTKTKTITVGKIPANLDNLITNLNTLNGLLARMLLSLHTYNKTSQQKDLNDTIQRLTISSKQLKVTDDSLQLLLEAYKNPATDIVMAVEDSKLVLYNVNATKHMHHYWANINHNILTSATLITKNKNHPDAFNYIIRALGLPTDEKLKTYKAVHPSTFDIQTNAMLYAPLHLPLAAYEPTARKIWCKAIADEIKALTDITNGNAFVLFTARKDLDDIHQYMPDNIKYIRQAGNSAEALKQYQAHPGSVLFGLKTYWEGIDIPGDRLKMVIIPKLPFTAATQPHIKALMDRSSNGFKSILIPHMTFDMRQGTGRLLRRTTDKGIVAILDPRIWTGTSNIQTHVARITSISNATVKKPMGYGDTLINVLGYTKRKAITLHTVRKFAATAWPI